MKRKAILSLIMVLSLVFTVSIPTVNVYANSDVENSNKEIINDQEIKPESVKINGTQVVGSTLEAQLYTDVGHEFYSTLDSNYKWYRLSSKDSEDGILIGESKTYVLSDSDADQYIKVVVHHNGDAFETTIGKIGKKSASSIAGIISYGYWLNNSDGTKMYYENGNYTNGWKKIDGVYYLFNYKGIMQTGWVRSDNKFYYLNSDGVMVTGWATIDGKPYFFNSDGSMASDTKIAGHKIDSNGICIS